MPNIYYQPEAYGLTVVGEIEMYDMGYGFDTTVLWRNEAGKYFWAHDSGCSCPVPFEECNLSNMSSGTVKEFKSFAKAQIEDWWDESRVNNFDRQLQDIILKTKTPTRSVGAKERS